MAKRCLVRTDPAHRAGEVLKCHHRVRRRDGSELGDQGLDRPVAQLADQARLPLVKPTRWVEQPAGRDDAVAGMGHLSIGPPPRSIRMLVPSSVGA